MTDKRVRIFNGAKLPLFRSNLNSDIIIKILSTGILRKISVVNYLLLYVTVIFDRKTL